MVPFQWRARDRAGRSAPVAIRSDPGRHAAQCPHIRDNVGASFRPIVHRCGAGRLCAIERFAADSATREVRHGMGRRASVPGNGVPLRRDRPAGIDTVHHDARHVRCRTDVAARAGHRTRGAWLPGRCGAQRWPCLVHRPRPGAPSWFARPGSLPNPAPPRVAADPATPTEPFLLAGKRSSAMPVKRMRAPRAARSPSGKPALLAHPRLVHGFLVRLPASSTIPAAYAKRAGAAVARSSAAAKVPVAATHEGPPDDATFH